MFIDKAYSVLNRVILCCLLICFPLTSAFSFPSNQSYNTCKDAKFGINVIRLAKDLNKYKGDDREKIVGFALNMRREVENYLNVKFDMSEYLLLVRQEMKFKGMKMSDDQFNALVKIFTKTKDKQKKKFFNFLNAQSYEEYMSLNDLTNEGKSHDEKEKEEKEIPTLLVTGVTMVLCGLFLICTRIPVCVEWGSKLVASGFRMAGACLSNEHDKNKSKNKNK